MVGQEVSFGDQKIHPSGVVHLPEAGSPLLGFLRLQHGCRQIRRPDAYCFDIGLYGGYL